MDRLKAQLLQQLQQRAYVELQNQLGEQEFLPPESMTTEIMAEVYDQFLDAEADVLHLQMRIHEKIILHKVYFRDFSAILPERIISSHVKRQTLKQLRAIFPRSKLIVEVFGIFGLVFRH